MENLTEEWLYSCAPGLSILNTVVSRLLLGGEISYAHFLQKARNVHFQAMVSWLITLTDSFGSQGSLVRSIV